MEKSIQAFRFTQTANKTYRDSASLHFTSPWRSYVSREAAISLFALDDGNTSFTQSSLPSGFCKHQRNPAAFLRSNSNTMR